MASCQTSPKKITNIQRATLESPNYVNELKKKNSNTAFDISSGAIGYVLYDPKTKMVLDRKNEDSSFLPASTTKVLTSVAALKILGPQFKFKTTLAYTGVIAKDGLNGDLYLKGEGDPSLTVAHLMSLVRSISDHRIDRVSGHFYYDESEVIPQLMIDKIGNFSAAYNPGLGGLSVDFNQFGVQWYPSQKSQSTLDVIITPDLPLIDVLLSIDSKKPQLPFIYEKDNQFGKWFMSSKLNASGQERLPVRLPSLFTALFFAKLCKMNGIILPAPEPKVQGKKATTLTMHQSEPLVVVLERALEYSNNMMTELVLLATARKLTGRPISLENAAELVKRWLKSKIKASHLDLLQLVNGSGLTPKNRITPAQLMSVLNYVDSSRFEGRSYESLLPISGWKGTLANRLKKPEVAFRVWAKTGTLSYSSALTGFLYTLKGRRLIFAIMLLNPDGREIVEEYPGEVPKDVEEDANAWNEKARRLQDSILENWILSY